jgi:hypothetical protein
VDTALPANSEPSVAISNRLNMTMISQTPGADHHRANSPLAP